MNSTHDYYKTNEINITDFSPSNIEALYDQGYKFTRLSVGNLQQTRSLRVDLSKFELSSENRRVLKKFPTLELTIKELPLPEYDWKIGKLAKDFYSKKFGENTFSANKTKELLTKKGNFNSLIEFSNTNEGQNNEVVGYVICYKTGSILHYSYPFYSLDYEKSSLGISMMTKTIDYCKQNGLKYVYLGGVTKPLDVYKLQFQGLEYYENAWLTNLDELKAKIQK
ncbi:MAG: GNAT family N-acetyltransferase [bacterium]